MALNVLQLTDFHLFADKKQVLNKVNTFESFTTVMELVKANNRIPDIVLLTGDLTHLGEADAYQAIIESCTYFDCPVYAIPGNHDNPTHLRNSFIGSDIGIEKSIVSQAWHIILLDSVIVGDNAGRLADNELHFLRQALQRYPHLPTLVTLHHHVQPVGGHMDGMILLNAEEFLTTINDHENVNVVLSGHVHQEYDQVHQNVRYLTSPSTCYQITQEEEKFSVDTSLAPGLRWLMLETDGTIETFVQRTC